MLILLLRDRSSAPWELWDLSFWPPALVPNVNRKIDRRFPWLIASCGTWITFDCFSLSNFSRARLMLSSWCPSLCRSLLEERCLLCLLWGNFLRTGPQSFLTVRIVPMLHHQVDPRIVLEPVSTAADRESEWSLLFESCNPHHQIMPLPQYALLRIDHEHVSNISFDQC